MAEIIVMPKLGLTMTEGNLSNWRKAEGDRIEQGDILFDVETDKLSNEIEAKVSGVLRKSSFATARSKCFVRSRSSVRRMRIFPHCWPKPAAAYRKPGPAS
ncbi:hypothetical protein HMSSN036_60400 [Paenibacillus macerans]|nr:hypothetical protein HMSSN036_60400 [Paenibacillus macerans]